MSGVPRSCPSKTNSRTLSLFAVALSTLLLVSSCGGEIGATAVSGQAIDAPLSNATVSLTLNAPLTQPGALVLGTTKADATGSFTLRVTFPNIGAPVFANAQRGNTLLSSYLGPANSLASLSVLSTARVPNLAISQVTTAALSILAATHQLTALTPATYASLLSNYRSDILATAAGIMAVADAHCALPSSVHNTFELGRALVRDTSGVSARTASPTLLNVSKTLSFTCHRTTLKTLLQAISASRVWAPQLELGDVVENVSPAVPPGRYRLEGLVSDSGIKGSNPVKSFQAPTPSVFIDRSVAVSSSGTLTSQDGHVSGQIDGNYLTLSLFDGVTTTSFSGKVGIFPAGLLSRTFNDGFSIRSGGQETSGNLAKFEAVLVPRNALPNWSGIRRTSEDGTGCTGSQVGFRIHGLGPTIGGETFNLCATPSAKRTALILDASIVTGENDFDPTAPISFLGPISMTATKTPIDMPFILTARAVSLKTDSGTVTGSLSYVMGSDEMIFSSNNHNSSFLMNENPLDKLAENPQNADH